MGSRNELSPRTLVLTDDAKRQWCEFHDEVERELGPDGRYCAVGDLGAKAAEHAARIAGVLTIVGDVRATEIGAETMARAVTLARWYLNEAVRLQQAARTDSRLLIADSVLKFVAARPGKVIQVRELIQLGPSKVRNKVAADEALDILCAHGLVVEVCKRPRTVRVIAEV